MTDNEPTVQVPVALPTREQIAEAIWDDSLLLELPENLERVDRVLALISQPTPTAQRWKERPHEVREDVNDYSMCLCGSPVAAALHDAELPRIEDMAPGTTFTEEVRWTVTGRLSTGSTVAHSESGEMRFADRIDPSTIRDVTPPKRDVTPPKESTDA